MEKDRQEKKDKLIAHTTQFTVSGYVSSVINFFVAIVVRRILSPYLMGIYAQLALIFEYAKYCHLGAIDSLDRQIPVYRGGGDEKTAAEAANVGISFSLLASVVCACVIIVFGIIRRPAIEPALNHGLYVISLLVITQIVCSFYVTLVRTRHLFGVLSRYVVLLAVSDLFLKFALGVKFGVVGILLGSVLSLFAGFAYLYRVTGIRFHIAFPVNIRVLKTLLAIGFPLLMAGFTFMVLKSIDRIMILSFLGKEPMGYYSIAIMMHSFAFQLPNLIYTVLFPRFYERFGRLKENVKELRPLLEGPTLAFSFIFPVIIGIAVILLPLFIRKVLPAYHEGIPAANILLFGTVFLSITNMSGYLLIALKKQARIVFIGVFSIICNILLNLYFIKILKMGITGIALGTGISFFLYSLVLISHALGLYLEKRPHRLKFIFKVYFPVFSIISLVIIINEAVERIFKAECGNTIDTTVRLIVFSFLSLPFLLYINKKHSIFRKIKDASSGIFRR